MRTADLFCGGGVVVGLSKHAELVLAVDNDPTALRWYRKNHPTHEAVCLDLSDTAATISSWSKESRAGHG